jgi:hypothetical protein
MRSKPFIKLQIPPFAHTRIALLSVRFATSMQRESRHAEGWRVSRPIKAIRHICDLYWVVKVV